MQSRAVEDSTNLCVSPSMLLDSVLPGRLHRSSPLFGFLQEEPVECPLSLLRDEWNLSSTRTVETQKPSALSSPLTAASIAQQAALLSQLSSQSAERARLAIQYETDQRLSIGISTDVPRVAYHFLNWPESPVVLGKSLTCCGIIFQGASHHFWRCRCFASCSPCGKIC